MNQLMMKRVVTIALLLFVGFVYGQQPKKSGGTKTKAPVTVKKKKPVEDEMKQYFLVFLKKGPKRDQDSATAAKIQEGHMAHLNKMYTEGKMDLAGPMGDDGDIRGICVYNVATLEEVKKLTEMDPAVQSGRLIVEIHPWWSAKGYGLR